MTQYETKEFTVVIKKSEKQFVALCPELGVEEHFEIESGLLRRFE